MFSILHWEKHIFSKDMSSTFLTLPFQKAYQAAIKTSGWCEVDRILSSKRELHSQFSRKGNQVHFLQSNVSAFSSCFCSVELYHHFSSCTHPFFTCPFLIGWWRSNTLLNPDFWKGRSNLQGNKKLHNRWINASRVTSAFFSIFPFCGLD